MDKHADKTTLGDEHHSRARNHFYTRKDNLHCGGFLPEWFSYLINCGRKVAICGKISSRAASAIIA